MIKVYGMARSRSSRVLWALEEAGLDYDFIKVDFAKGEQRDAAFLALNPAAKVPVFVHDDLVLTESGAILNYIATQFSPNLIPRNAIDRAHYDRWCYFAISELEQGLWTLAKHTFALSKDLRVDQIKPTAQWEYQQALKILSQGLGDKTYILGDRFSMADVLICQVLKWGVDFKQRLNQDNLKAYIERMSQRDAFLRFNGQEKT